MYKFIHVHRFTKYYKIDISISLELFFTILDVTSQSDTNLQYAK